MKSTLLILLFSIVTCTLSAQTNIYVSHNGTDTGANLPTINNPAKTLEIAYNYIKNNLSNANNQATTPINVYLMDDGGDILVTNTGTDLRLDWEVSGTASNPILLTSYSSRATLTRNSDTENNPILQLIGVNHMTIKAIDFSRAIGGGITIDNGDDNSILYCSFHGDGGSQGPSNGGAIWVGAIKNYNGINTLSSSNNTIAYNLIYDIKIDSATDKHHGIYLSNGAHDNSVAHNYINFAPVHGILGQHGDYKDNYISTNLVSTKFQSAHLNKTGISLSGQKDKCPKPPGDCIPYDNGHPNSITDNIAVNNYVYDSDDSNAVSIADNITQFNNTESNNIPYNNLYPADPYWLGYTADKITDKMVTGDFDEDGAVDDVAAFYDLGNQTKIHVWRSKDDDNAFEYSSSNGWWHGTSFTPSKINKRVVVGDFDNDTYKDDIAVFYDYGGFNTKIWVWISNGVSFEAPQEWWPSSGFNSNQISGRVVAGDFDEDGWEDDIAAFYDNGSSVTKLHVWRSNGIDDEFQHMGSSSQWTGPVYSASAITDRVVSGDFDNDGFKDDIAAFYNNGGNNTILHVWKWSLPNVSGDPDGQFDMFNWWNVGGYNANSITGRVVSGDFDGNGMDDIGAFYDNTNGNTNIHTWLSSGTHITYQGSSGWWTENDNGYNVQNITGRVVSGDFNDDGKYDISAFYDYSSALGSIRSNVWHSSGSNSFTKINESLGYPWLTDFSYFPIGTANLMARIEPATEEQDQELIRVYPNPTSDQVQFDFKDSPLSIKVFDLSGRMVINKDISNKFYALDVSDQAAGIYFYKVLFKDKTLEGRLVIE